MVSGVMRALDTIKFFLSSSGRRKSRDYDVHVSAPVTKARSGGPQRPTRVQSDGWEWRPYHRLGAAVDTKKIGRASGAPREQVVGMKRCTDGCHARRPGTGRVRTTCRVTYGGYAFLRVINERYDFAVGDSEPWQQLSWLTRRRHGHRQRAAGLANESDRDDEPAK